MAEPSGAEPHFATSDSLLSGAPQRSTTPSLEGCWAKLRRADLHLQELNAKIREYMDAGHASISESYDPGNYSFEVRIEAAEPPNRLLWGVILGDVIHNLRSALDHLVWQLVLLGAERIPGRQHQFPIALTEAEYLGGRGLRERMLAGVAEDHRAVIDRVQPFRLGDNASGHSLAHLKRLSNTDKHRVLPVTAFTTQAPLAEDFTFGDIPDDCEIEVVVPSGTVAGGPTVLGIVRIQGAQHFDPSVLLKKGEFRIEFGFTDGEGQGLTSASFRELWSRVGSIVFDFRQAFGSAGEIPVI